MTHECLSSHHIDGLLENDTFIKLFNDTVTDFENPGSTVSLLERRQKGFYVEFKHVVPK